MTKLKELEADIYINRFLIILIAIFVILAIVGLCILRYQMPKEVCISEDVIEKVILEKWVHLDYPYEVEILCEGDVFIGEYDYLNQKTIYVYDYDDGKTCLIKYQKETCELK